MHTSIWTNTVRKWRKKIKRMALICSNETLSALISPWRMVHGVKWVVVTFDLHIFLGCPIKPNYCYRTSSPIVLLLLKNFWFRSPISSENLLYQFPLKRTTWIHVLCSGISWNNLKVNKQLNLFLYRLSLTNIYLTI